MKQSDIAKVLEAFGRERVPLTPVLWGSTGIGKSEAVAQVAKRLGRTLIDIRLGERVDSADLIGIPFKDNDPELGPVMRYHRPEWLVRAIKKGNAVLFFDEINRARKDILQGVFEIVRDRKFDGEPIADSVLIVCACNPPDERNNTLSFDDALTARFMHINVELDNRDWLEWASQAGIHPQIVKYIHLNPEALNRRDERDSFFPVDVYPNPRAWGLFVNEIMKTSLPEELKRQCVRGVIGAEQTAAFFKSFNLEYEPVLARDVFEGRIDIITRIQKYSSSENLRMDLLSATVENFIIHSQELLPYSSIVVSVLRELPKEQATACVRGLLDKTKDWAEVVKGDSVLVEAVIALAASSKELAVKIRPTKKGTPSSSLRP